jgi:hypothetical protein
VERGANRRDSIAVGSDGSEMAVSREFEWARRFLDHKVNLAYPTPCTAVPGNGTHHPLRPASRVRETMSLFCSLAERRKPPPGTLSRSPLIAAIEFWLARDRNESIRSSDSGTSRPFATDLLDAGRAAPLPGGDHLQMKVSRGRHLFSLSLGASSRPSPSAWSDPRIPHYTEVSFALLW